MSQPMKMGEGMSAAGLGAITKEQYDVQRGKVSPSATTSPRAGKREFVGMSGFLSPRASGRVQPGSPERGKSQPIGQGSGSVRMSGLLSPRNAMPSQTSTTQKKPELKVGEGFSAADLPPLTNDDARIAMGKAPRSPPRGTSGNIEVSKSPRGMSGSLLSPRKASLADPVEQKKPEVVSQPVDSLPPITNDEIKRLSGRLNDPSNSGPTSGRLGDKSPTIRLPSPRKKAETDAGAEQVAGESQPHMPKRVLSTGRLCDAEAATIKPPEVQGKVDPGMPVKGSNLPAISREEILRLSGVIVPPKVEKMIDPADVKYGTPAVPKESALSRVLSPRSLNAAAEKVKTQQQADAELAESGNFAPVYFPQHLAAYGTDDAVVAKQQKALMERKKLEIEERERAEKEAAAKETAEKEAAAAKAEARKAKYEKERAAAAAAAAAAAEAAAAEAVAPPDVAAGQDGSTVAIDSKSSASADNKDLAKKKQQSRAEAAAAAAATAAALEADMARLRKIGLGKRATDDDVKKEDQDEEEVGYIKKDDKEDRKDAAETKPKDDAKRDAEPANDDAEQSEKAAASVVDEHGGEDEQHMGDAVSEAADHVGVTPLDSKIVDLTNRRANLLSPRAAPNPEAWKKLLPQDLHPSLGEDPNKDVVAFYHDGIRLELSDLYKFLERWEKKGWTMDTAMATKFYDWWSIFQECVYEWFKIDERVFIAHMEAFQASLMGFDGTSRANRRLSFVSAAQEIGRVRKDMLSGTGGMDTMQRFVTRVQEIFPTLLSYLIVKEAMMTEQIELAREYNQLQDENIRLTKKAMVRETLKLKNGIGEFVLCIYISHLKDAQRVEFLKAHLSFLQALRFSTWWASYQRHRAVLS
ncbi:hypothetical protein FVE85_7919 [Porphyridium purpureum]|uniref:Uncharacterized protein n=1 Tax=Porphyridium purpureum TaxID=35688 RepID=A0A5J4YN49_PORPP|nr:hypothetical protein FVE85_7919 [Porphyridium purpureum]|eukprot:POR9532..scf295_9